MGRQSWRRSFRCAWAGICWGIKTQRNLRFHLCGAVFAHWMGLLAGLSPAELGEISLCCGLVIGLELCNTAVEAVCDRVSLERHPLIRVAKDTAAGAVLAAACFAVLTAVWLFGDWVCSGGLWQMVCTRWGMDMALAAALAASVCFVRGCNMDINQTDNK